MKIYLINRLKIFYTFLLITVIGIVSCTNPSTQTVPADENKENTKSKPPSSFSDTIVVNIPSAIFFNPDSLQLIKIKAITDSMVFKSMEHDCFFQMRNARNIIDKYYLGVEIINLTKARFLLFEYKNGIKELIDLDSNNDPCGIYLFDGSRKPVITDMTNIETALSNYFEK